MSEEEKLAPEEFERLFELDLPEYIAEAPAWIRKVEPIDVREGVGELLDQLRKASKKTKKLEHVLTTNRVPIPQDIPYVVAKQKVMEINNRIMSGGDMDERTYMALCTDLEKYTTAMMASDEYHEEMRQAEAKWEESHRADNIEALKALRRHMPVNVRSLSEDALVNEHKLPRPIARKFKRTDVLSLIRKAPGDIEKMHPGILENLKTGGLTLTERRALYEHLRTVHPKWMKAKDEMSQRKAQWYNNFKAKFKESADAWLHHKDQYGSPQGHGKCNKIGMQCPFKADAAVDYSGNYGQPTGDVYEQDQVTKAPKPFVKEDDSAPAKKPANPMAAALAQIKRPSAKPSFLGELSKKAAPSKSSTPSSASVPSVVAKSKAVPEAIAKAAPSSREAMASTSKQNVMQQIKQKTPEQIAAEKEAKKEELRKQKYAAKKASRDNVMETHYKNKDDALNEARVLCYTMDDAMDDMEALLEDWIAYVVRTGSKTLDQEAIDEEIWDFKEGIRPIEGVIDQYLEHIDNVGPSTVECELAEDFYLCTTVFFNFMQWRAATLKQKDKELNDSLKEHTEKLKTLYQKNARKLKQFGVTAERTRNIPSAKEIMDRNKKKIADANKPKPKAAAPAPAPATAPAPAPAPEKHSSITMKTKPTPVKEKPKRSSSFSSRTIEFGGKEHLKWQLIHQLNDAQKMVRRLESAISGAGLTIPDDTIPYQEAEAKIAEISHRMAEMTFKDPEYFTLEQEMAKYTAALLSSDEYRRETERREREWEASIHPLNREALKQIRRCMPVNVRKMSEAELAEKIPMEMARKFKRTNVLQLLRVNPNDVAKFHHSNFEGMSLAGMTLTERRALYEHLHSVGPTWFKQKSNEMIERKWQWFQSMKNKFRDDLKKWETHLDKFGPPENHKCNFIGNQCPVKANKVLDYSIADYGFPEGAEYEVMEVAREDLSHSKKRATELRAQRDQDRRSSKGAFAPGISKMVGQWQK